MKLIEKNALILFAKDPVRGKVKTRLTELYDPQIICDLYKCFLTDSINQIKQVKGVDRFAFVFPNLSSGYFEFLESNSLKVELQEGENLGQRMEVAIRQKFKMGYERVVIIGADSPTLPIKYIELAFNSERDIVLGPSTDGGYYLIGMKEKFLSVFEGIDWGTERVLEQTLHWVRQIKATFELLPVWYDVDFPNELAFLKTHLDCMELAGNLEGKVTRKFLQSFKFEKTT